MAMGNIFYGCNCVLYVPRLAEPQGKLLLHFSHYLTEFRFFFIVLIVMIVINELALYVFMKFK